MYQCLLVRRFLEQPNEDLMRGTPENKQQHSLYLSIAIYLSAPRGLQNGCTQKDALQMSSGNMDLSPGEKKKLIISISLFPVSMVNRIMEGNVESKEVVKWFN